LDGRVNGDARSALIRRLEEAGSVVEADEALAVAREWIERHPDDAEVIGTAGRLGPRAGAAGDRALGAAALDRGALRSVGELGRDRRRGAGARRGGA
jgi:hypothetical protein